MPNSEEQSGINIEVLVQPKASRDEIDGFKMKESK
jgi:uncharacterized protein YggU (UPF0235/DUF167 family)